MDEAERLTAFDAELVLILRQRRRAVAPAAAAPSQSVARITKGHVTTTALGGERSLNVARVGCPIGWQCASFVTRRGCVENPAISGLNSSD